MKKCKPYPYELATKAQRRIGYPWWCIHHEERLEPLTEPVENRVRCILTDKPEQEQETRLRALRPMQSLPRWLTKVYAAVEKAYAARGKADAVREKVYAALEKREKVYAAREKVCAAVGKADAALDRAYAALEKALLDHAPEINAMFAVECSDVAWNENGLVFPRKKPRRRTRR